MNSKSIWIAVAAFVAGGLLTWGTVSATARDAAPATNATDMSAMTESLRSKTGDDYDKLSISHMIEHHEAAVEMAKQSASQAKHDEIKQLSAEIITAQEAEISTMKQWQRDWDYEADQGVDHTQMSH